VVVAREAAGAARRERRAARAEVPPLAFWFASFPTRLGDGLKIRALLRRREALVETAAMAPPEAMQGLALRAEALSFDARIAAGAGVTAGAAVRPEAVGAAAEEGATPSCSSRRMFPKPM